MQVLRSKNIFSVPRFLAITLVMAFCFASQAAGAPHLTASYYTLASCLREGTSGIMANGRRLNDNDLTCASWDYRFGTRLRVTNCHNGKSVVVVVTDRGPAKRLYRKGCVVDLSR
jgi:rare lipoprotein A